MAKNQIKTEIMKLSQQQLSYEARCFIIIFSPVYKAMLVT